MLAPVIVFGAFLCQWQIASRILHAPVEIPMLSEEFGVLYQTKDFWTAGGMEIVVLAAAMTAGNTLLGRALVAVVLAGVWVIGWRLTPDSVKNEALGILRGFLILEIFDGARRLARRR